MGSLNRVQLIGHVGSEPKRIIGKDGKEFLSVSIATNEGYMKGDEWNTKTTWHQLLLFGHLATCDDYLQKGNQVFVEGKIQNSQWQDKNGVSRQSVNVVVNFVRWLSKSEKAVKAPDMNAKQHIDELHQLLEQTDIEH